MNGKEKVTHGISKCDKIEEKQTAVMRGTGRQEEKVT